MSPPAIPAPLLSRAMNPNLEFGAGIIPERSRAWGRYLLVTTPPVHEAVGPMLARPPALAHFVASMDRNLLERLEPGIPPADTIVGIGGGAALDLAKFIAWRRGQEPVLVPSIASVDAAVTNSVAVRDDRKVRYIAFVVPQVVIADFTLMKTAPPHLNRAGIGDLLSIHTGSHDWGLAAAAGEVADDAAVARQAAVIVDRLEGLAGEVRAVTDNALRFLIEAYAEENALCLRVGHSRPEEGSEHFFAYHLEHLTRRDFVHGEIVCLGALLMARLQRHRPERVENILAATGVRYQPQELGITRAELEQTLTSLPAYVRSEGLFHSIIDESTIDSLAVNDICRGLEFI